MEKTTELLFSEAMRMKLSENRKFLAKEAQADPSIARLLRMNSLPGRTDAKLKALPAAAAKKAFE
jgi:hypothetical protein|tara:strand:- start:4167 stop:4361 length:195 start_codon:yes stop_codon:yes gene_type:complete